MHVGFLWDPSLFDYRGVLGNPYGGSLVEALQRYGITFERLEYTGRRNTVNPAPQLTLLWVWRSRRRIDAVHLHWLSGFVSAPSAWRAWWRLAQFIATLTLARALGIRVIWTLHNMLPHERPHRGVDVVGRYAMALLASAIICHCEYARRTFSQRFKRRRNVFVIPHGNFMAAYPSRSSQSEARRVLDLPTGAFVFLAFGNIRTYKGLDDLEQALARVPDANVRLLIAGARSQGYQGHLGERLVADPRLVLREGRVPIEDVELLFNAADVAVFPYRDALTSGALITALGFGKPVISTRVGCIPETMSDPAMGRLVPPGDTTAFGEAMREAMTWDLAARGGAARQRAAELNWDGIARQTLSAYGVRPIN